MNERTHSPDDKIADAGRPTPPAENAGAGGSDQPWEFRRDTEYLYNDVPSIAKPGTTPPPPPPPPESNGTAKAGGAGFVIFLVIYFIVRAIGTNARNNPPPPVHVQIPQPQFQMPPPQQFQLPPQQIKMPNFKDLPVAGLNLRIPARTFRSGHKGGVLAFAADQDLLITAGHDGFVCTWSLRDGKRIKQLRGHTGAVTSLVTGKNNIAISGGTDGNVRLWDFTTGETRKVFGPYPSGVTAVALAPDEKTFVVACGLKKYRYSYFEPLDLGAAGGPNWAKEELHWLRPPKAVCQAFVVDIESGETRTTFSGHKNELTCAAFAPDGLHVVTGALDKTIRLWESTSGREVRRIDEAGAVLAVAISADGKELLAGAGKLDSVPGRSPSTSRPIPIRDQFGNDPLDPNVKAPEGMGSAQLWDLNTGKSLRALPGLDFPVLSVAFESRGSRFAIGDFGGNIKVWRRDQDQPTTTYSVSRAVSHVRFQAGGALLVSSWNSTVSLWLIP